MMAKLGRGGPALAKAAMLVRRRNDRDGPLTVMAPLVVRWR